MILPKKYFQIAIFAFFALFSAVHAQDKMMAIIDIQLVGDAKKYVSAEERQYLSTAIRSQASQVLGGQIEILSQAKFKKLVKANAEGCSEAGCFAGFIAEIGVDLGMQPTISYAFGKLKMTLEVADNRATISSRTLSAAPTEDGKNQLGEDAEIAAKELFMELATKLGTFNTAPQVKSNTQSKQTLQSTSISSSDNTEVSTDFSSSNSNSDDQDFSTQKSSTVQSSKTKENVLYDYEIPRGKTTTSSKKSKRKTDAEIDHSGLQHSLRASLGFASFAEGLIGVRYGVSYNGIGTYLGYGVLPIIVTSSSEVSFSPVWGVVYKKGKTELSAQVESWTETSYDMNYTYTTNATIYMFQFFRDFGAPDGFGFYIGLGYMDLIDSESYSLDYYSTSESYPLISIALSYEFL